MNKKWWNQKGGEQMSYLFDDFDLDIQKVSIDIQPLTDRHPQTLSCSNISVCHCPTDINCQSMPQCWGRSDSDEI